ncbi:MAG: pilus assembly protein TadG-related protein [Acidimicrobiia bacterium]
MARFLRRVRDREGADRGFYMVWMALTLVTLTAFAGLGLEFSRWNNISNRIQKAADAAALGGAVFMPENVGNVAFTTAKSVASKNGFTHGTNGVAITTVAGALPNQLKVTISVPTNNPWGQIVNYGSTTITRSAVAEYQLPQNLGSPENVYGNDPESSLTQPQFWGNLFGPSSSKNKGDAVQGAGPSASSSLCNADNCASSINKDYSANGYFYGIDVPAGATGALNVEVFDPAFVHVGDRCGDGDANAQNSLNQAATLTAIQIPGYSGSITPAVRYASAGSSAFCTGDQYYADGSNTANPWTIWTLREPDVTTWEPSNNPIVCQAEFPGVYPERANDLPNGAIDATRLKTLLQQSTDYPGTNPARTFASFFRQWVQLCSVANPVQGTYFLQVQTATKIAGTATPNGGGSNRYSIRVGLGANFSSTNNLRLYGNSTMGIYANATGADTRFYLTRVLPGEAGHTLILNFFDTGDASQPGAIAVLPPPDSNVSGGAFANCEYTQPPGNSTGPPWGTFIATGSGCQISGVSSSSSPGPSYNGQWVMFQVPIPETYDCDDTDPLGCWTRLRFTYPVGTSVNDTTTWMAFMLGDPVRLIQ